MAGGFLIFSDGCVTPLKMNITRNHCYNTALAFKAYLRLLGLAFLLIPFGSTMADPAMMAPRLVTDIGTKYDEDQRSFQGIPGIAVTGAGRLWAVWYGGGKGPGPGNYVMLAKSDDSGRNWSRLQLVVESDLRVFDPAIWVDPQGQLWVFFSHGHTLWDGRAGVWAAVARNPDAELVQWEEPRRIADGIMLNKPTALANGDWLLPIAVWNQKPNAGLAPESPLYVPNSAVHWDESAVGSHVYISSDRGESFSKAATVSIDGVMFDEHMITEQKDGSLRFYVRHETKGILVKESHDQGHSWVRVEEPPIPHVPARFFVRTLASGRILLVKHNPELDSEWLHGHGVGEPRKFRARLVAYLSEDGGRNWLGGLVIDERVGVSYPDGDQDEDGNIYIAYDFDRMRAKELLLATFTEEDVLAGQLVSEASRLRQLINKATGVNLQ